MMRRFNIEALKTISQLPATGEPEWLVAAEDSVAFLKEIPQSDEVVIYASGPATLNGYSTMGELLVGLSTYIAFYNAERPHQGLQYQTPDAVYASGVGGGAVIVDRYPAAQAIPIPLRSTGTTFEASHIENVTRSEDQNPGQRRPAACEIRDCLN